MARLIPGAGIKAVRLGQGSAFSVIFQRPHLAIAVDAALGAGDDVIHVPVPQALVHRGDFSFFLTFIGEAGDNPAQRAVFISLYSEERPALQRRRDHVPVCRVHGDVHRVPAADVDGVQVLKRPVLQDPVGGELRQVAVDAVEIFLLPVQALIAGVFLCEKTLLFLPCSALADLIDHKAISAGVSFFRCSASYISDLHGLSPSACMPEGFH